MVGIVGRTNMMGNHFPATDHTMTSFRTAHAAADDWAHAVKECVDRLGELPSEAGLGFVYVTDLIAEDFSSVLTYLRQKTGIEYWVGSVGLGICAGTEEYFDTPAVAVMVTDLSADAFRVFPAISKEGDGFSDDQQAWIERTRPTFGIVHADPNNAEILGLIDGLGHESAAFLVGGLTSSRNACHQVAGRLTGGGVSGILFAPDVTVATGLSQGCTPISETHVVSDCVDNVIVGLDGRRALDVFKEDVGDPLARDLNRAAGIIHAAIPVEGSDTGDYLVRNLVAIDPVRGWLAINNEMEPGDRMMFVRRDPRSAEMDLERLVGGLVRRIDGPPKGGVYFSCIARGANMFGEGGREVARIRDGLGDFPLVGFYAGGEISNSRLYTYTGVLALFL